MNNNSNFGYVHTESGPVKPAKTVSIETVRNLVASIQGKHVRGEKGTNWGELAKKINKDCNPHPYTTMQTILNKALTEAATQAVGQSLFRLDLGNVVCDAAHAKFKITRRNHSVIVDMLYPNDNGNITIRYNVDDVAEKMFELSLDSEHYINGFGRTIISCCDTAIKEAEEMTEEEDIYSTDEFGYQPIMSADMRGLLQMTNAIMESDMGGGDAGGFGEADFSADAADVAGAMGGGDMGGGAGGAAGGAAGLGGDIDNPEDEVNFADACRGILNTDPETGTYKKLATIVADTIAEQSRESSSGEYLTAKQVRDGTRGIAKDWSADTLIAKFQEQYKAFDGMVSGKEMNEFEHFLNSNDVNSAMDFDAWVLSNPTMKELYKRKGVGLQGTETKDGLDNVDLPSDGTEAANGAADAMGGAGGDMGAMGGAGFDGGMGAVGGDMGAVGGAGFGGDMGAAGGAGFGGDMSAVGGDVTGDMSGMEGMPADNSGAAFGGEPDINQIGEVDKISENTSEELPNLGGEAAAPVDENASPV